MFTNLTDYTERELDDIYDTLSSRITLLSKSHLLNYFAIRRLKKQQLAVGNVIWAKNSCDGIFPGETY